MKFTTNANTNNEHGSDTAILIDRALEQNAALQVGCYISTKLRCFAKKCTNDILITLEID